MASPKRSIIPMIDINYKNFSPAEKRLLISSLAMNGMILIFLPRPLPKGFMFLKLLCPDLLKKWLQGLPRTGFCLQNQEKKKHASMTNITKGVLSIYEDLLEKEYDLIDEAQLDRIVEYINSYSRIFVGGKGSSGIAAEEMELRFMRIGININAISYVDRMRMQTVFMDDALSGDRLQYQRQQRGCIIYAAGSPSKWLQNHAGNSL